MASFVMKCSDGNVPVSNKDAEQVLAKNEYFGRLFASGMLESSTRYVKRLNWTTSLAKLIINFIVDEDVHIMSAQEAVVFVSAADEILAMKATRSTCGYIPMDNPTTMITCLDRFSSSPPVFRIVGLHRLSIVKEIHNRRLSMFPSNGLMMEQSKQDELPRPSLDAMQHDVDVYCDDGMDLVSAIETFCSSLHIPAEDDETMNEGFWLCLPVSKIPGTCEGVAMAEYVANLAKVKQYSGVEESFCAHHTPPEYNLPSKFSSGPCLILFGPPQSLLMALEHFLELASDYIVRAGKFRGRIVCSLRANWPSTRILSALVPACFSCKRKPGTLGVNYDASDVVAVKTSADMKLLLRSLIELLDSGDHYDAANGLPIGGFSLYHLGASCALADF